MAASTAPESDIRLRGITKRFGDLTAVDDIDLDVLRGEFLALLGPSGCGKTTTLRMVAGFEEPTAGQILLDGRDVVGVPPHKRDVNTVFQQYALFPHMNVLDNVAYGLKQRGEGKAERRRKALEALDLVHLPERAASRPSELSGGQQQRVALARALVMRPRVLLLDEPLGALDLKLRKAMQVELKRIQREVGITFIVVTHDQEEAMAMADRIAVMHEGRIDQLGAPSEIYDRPATPFVADFIGEMNHLEGTLERTAGGELAVELAGSRVGVGRVVRDAEPGSRVLVGIRPEELHARLAGGGHPATTVTSMVLGQDIQTVARLADGSEVVARQRRAGSEDLAGLSPGASVHLEWPARSALLLGPAGPDAVSAPPGAVPAAAEPQEVRA
jgi:spermidine/putrescine transport system ATP-binding protein